ncbi:MAG: hypothetical protein ABI542_00775 [Gemmatimonadota bacterium]
MTTTRHYHTVSLALLALLLAAPAVATAQSTSTTPPRWEFNVSSGRLVPTGAQRTAITGGGVTAAQLSFVPGPIAVTTTLGWARTRDLGLPNQPRLDAFLVDIGAELRAPRVRLGKVALAPFGGAGMGLRSYNHRSLAIDATHNLAGFLGGGVEAGLGRVRLRVELRDYVSGFKALDGSDRGMIRNDMAILAGLRLAPHR